MKKWSVFCVMLLFLLTTSLYGCGDTKVIDGVEYDTYGILNSNNKKNEKIEYDYIVGNVVWGIILFETIIAPVYFFGFSLFEPVGEKSETIKGQKL
jgi:hypothetical protein